MVPVSASMAAAPYPSPRTNSTVSRISRCGIRSATAPPISTDSTRPRLAPTATVDRSVAEPPSWITCQTEATSQMPTLSSEHTRAAVSSRYWPLANGRSARGSFDTDICSAITLPFLLPANRKPDNHLPDMDIPGKHLGR